MRYSTTAKQDLNICKKHTFQCAHDSEYEYIAGIK